jgi:hypothetical protein
VRKSRNLVSVESKGLVAFFIFHEDGSILCLDKDPISVFNMVITSLTSNFCLSFHHQLTSNVDKQIVAAQMHSCCGKRFLIEHRYIQSSIATALAASATGVRVFQLNAGTFSIN